MGNNLTCDTRDHLDERVDGSLLSSHGLRRRPRCGAVIVSIRGGESMCSFCCLTGVICSSSILIGIIYTWSVIEITGNMLGDVSVFFAAAAAQQSSSF
jgi:hypothetical protein